jgi:hypothetical protein
MHPTDPNYDPTAPPTATKPIPWRPGLEPETYRAPVCSFHWDKAELSAPFLAALARAQADIRTVGKDATTEGAVGSPKFNYATGDAIVEELRTKFAKHGISFLSGWRQLDPPAWLTISDKQWPDWTIVLDFVLLYGDAEGNVGKLPGEASCIAIGSAGRPPDKSAFAARSSLAGYVALGLGAIDRGKIDPDEDIHQRRGDEAAAGGRRESPTDPQRVNAERRKAEAKWKLYEVVHKQSQGRDAGKLADWSFEALGRSPMTADEWGEITARLDDAIATIKSAGKAADR